MYKQCMKRVGFLLLFSIILVYYVISSFSINFLYGHLQFSSNVGKIVVVSIELIIVAICWNNP